MKINNLQSINKELVEAARNCLVIGDFFIGKITLKFSSKISLKVTLGGISYQLKVNGYWDAGNGVIVESGHLNVKLKDVEFALNVIPKEQPTHLKKKSIK